MKSTIKTLLALLALSASALLANAQDFGGPPPDGNQGPRGMGPGNGSDSRNTRRPPPNVLMDALDTNHDGIIDANEIANASAALKKLDKNGDGKLTPDELRPQRPQRGNAQAQGPDRQGPPDGAGESRPPHPDGQRPPQGGTQGGPPGN
jgi:hypothetical protein